MIRLLEGDCRETLASLPEQSVHTVVTSPPYWSLRDYGTEPLVWGGDPSHEHEWINNRWYKEGGASGHKHGGAFQTAGEENAQGLRDQRWYQDSRCECGAWLGSLGLEPTPEMFVEHMVECFRAVWRVLRDDGTLWLNIGDSYAGSGSHGGNEHNGYTGGRGKTSMFVKAGQDLGFANAQKRAPTPEGLKTKDLVGIPWMLAFALRADGWYLRSDIIWSKPNPMPESVTDRPTKAHEYLFLLTKSGNTTFWTHRDQIGSRTRPTPDYRWLDQANDDAETAIVPSDWRTEKLPDGRLRWRRIQLWSGHDYFYDADAIRESVGEPIRMAASFRDGGVYTNNRSLDNGADKSKLTHGDGASSYAGRNKRSVWEIATHSFSEAHFATFPPKLVEPCIKAGTSEKGVCSECGAPWVRVVERVGVREVIEAAGKSPRLNPKGIAAYEAGHRNGVLSRNGNDPRGPQITTTGWRPSCEHDTKPVPATVLDAFAGAGTVGMVADRHGRNAVLCELKAGYADMGMNRLVNDAPLFVELERG